MSENRPDVRGYEPLDLLGFGASGEVWSAREIATGDTVALKVVRLADGDDLAARDRIRREAAVLSALRHPHLVRLRGVVSRENDLVLVLDHAAGGSLRGLLAMRGRLIPGEVVTLGSPLAEALASLHERGVVHGDVAPGNVLWTADGRPLLADLGIARLVGEPVGDLDRELDGTDGYVDPALALGEIPSPAADVYGLAAVCFLALAGAPPYQRGSRRRLTDLAPDVPAALVAALDAALDPRPDRRPTAAQFAVALFDSARATPVRLVPATGPEPSAPVSPGRHSATAGPRADTSARRHSAPAAAAARVGAARVDAPDPGSLTRRVRTPLRPAPQEPPRASAVMRARQAARTAARPALWCAGAVLAFAGAAAAGTAWASWSGHTPSEVRAQPSAAPSRATPSPDGAEGSPPRGSTPASPRGTGEATAAAPDWRAVLDSLYAAREQAFAADAEGSLTQVYAPGSPDLAYTRRLLSALHASGQRATGARLRVVSAAPVGAVPPSARRVTLAVVDRLSAGALLDAQGGQVGELPARRPAAARIVLVRTADGWRIERTTAAT